MPELFHPHHYYAEGSEPGTVYVEVDFREAMQGDLTLVVNNVEALKQRTHNVLGWHIIRDIIC